MEAAAHSLAERHAWLTKRLVSLGITRIAATTGLDRLGIPTHSATVPGTTDAIWVYSGKGLTPERSRVGAIMEAVERTSAQWGDAWFAATEAAARAQAGCVWGPGAFTENRDDLRGGQTAWLVASRAHDGLPVAVPADLVHLGRRPSSAPRSAFAVRTSNGLAAGFTRTEALTAALLEVAERDVVSTYDMQFSHIALAGLAGLCRRLGIDPDAVLSGYQDDNEAGVTIDPVSAPEPLPALARRFEDAGLDLTLKLLPNDFGLPVFGAAVAEHLGFDTVLATAGYGIDGDPVAAATGALLELAQSRATDRQGAREDCGLDEKGRLPRVPSSHWLLTPGPLEPWSTALGRPVETSVRGLLGRFPAGRIGAGGRSRPSRALRSGGRAGPRTRGRDVACNRWQLPYGT